VGRFSPVIRISFGLVLVTSYVLVLLDLVGLTPIPRDTALQARVRLCEAIAAQAAIAAERTDVAAIRTSLQVAVRRNEDVLSAGLRDTNGRLLAATPEHRALWGAESAHSSTTHVQVPLSKRGRPWASLELRFMPLHPGGLLQALWHRPIVRLIVLLGLGGFLANLIYMRRTLQYLDPSAVIPTRVQAALDVMAEGVMLLDAKGRIVLANTAFSELSGRPVGQLLGAEASQIDWRSPDGGPAQLPWEESLRTGASVPGTPLRLETEECSRSFIVKAAPVLDGKKRPKGAIATVDDVTELERKSAELEKALSALEKSQEEIRLQNDELQVLARCDPLTGVSNRRVFLDSFDAEYERMLGEGRTICCLMADLDHFKAINDSRGHQEGDDVLRRVAEVLKAEVRSSDAICRYGGEEFCIALRDVDLDQAVAVAERMRCRVAAPAFARVAVTVSIGLSSSELGAASWDELVKQADDALYASKAAGRNRVTRWYGTPTRPRPEDGLQ
jgi:diguanylate cyclase (GGDEF)-like protein/PAS domain S-box-containing protein